MASVTPRATPRGPRVGTWQIVLASAALFVARAVGQSTVTGPLTYPAGTTNVPSSGSSSTLTTSGTVTVPNGASVNYTASTRISLEPGFSVFNGGVFHAQVPLATVAIVGGNNQSTAVGQFNAEAFDAAVWNGNATQPMVGVPLTFTVASGGGLLATSPSSQTLVGSLTLNTDGDGTAKVYYQQPATVGAASQITATYSTAQAVFTTTSTAPTTPPSAPGWVHTLTSTPTVVTFTWANATAYGGTTIAGYNIYRNGTLLNGSPQMSTSYVDTTVIPGATYTYTIKSVDSQGQISAAISVAITAPGSSTTGSFDVYTPNQ